MQMRANPGGVIAVEDVVGRDDLTARIWSVLENQSVVLTSERRLGKTSVIRKMVAACGSHQVCFARDIEDYRSATEFIEGIYADAEPILSKAERAGLGLWKLLGKLGGTEIGHVKLPNLKPHWKSILLALFQDIFEREERQVVFFWDELPLFLHNVKANGGAREAMELLDVLRSLRQKYPKLRMVFAGSVGIHQVVQSLRKHGYANDPTNDMAIIEVPPLTPEHGKHLARLLLEGERIKIVDDVGGTSEALSAAAAHIPFYIHYLVSRISNSGAELGRHSVQGCLNELIQDPSDPAHFSYYESRLATHYDPPDAKLALDVLDTIAVAGRPLPFGELLNLVNHKSAVEEEPLRQVLETLLKDHYLARTPERAYAFRYSIVEKWWAYTRG